MDTEIINIDEETSKVLFAILGFYRDRAKIDSLQDSTPSRSIEASRLRGGVANNRPRDAFIG